MKEIPEGKSGIIGNLLRVFSRVQKKWWLIIICSLFLILAIPLMLGIVESINQKHYFDEKISQLILQYDNLKLKLDTRSTANAEIAQLKADIDATRLKYQSVVDNPLIVKSLFSLASKCDITITNLSVVQTSGTLNGRDFKILSYGIGLSGQSAAFQNFLLLLGDKLPGCQIVEIVLTPAQAVGELDKASINIQVYCID